MTTPTQSPLVDRTGHVVVDPETGDRTGLDDALGHPEGSAVRRAAVDYLEAARRRRPDGSHGGGVLDPNPPAYDLFLIDDDPVEQIAGDIAGYAAGVPDEPMRGPDWHAKMLAESYVATERLDAVRHYLDAHAGGVEHGDLAREVVTGALAVRSAPGWYPRYTP